jgi:hypothetical protein
MGGELIIPLMAFLFALYYWVTIWDLTWEAQINGLLIGGVLIALTTIFFIRTLFRFREGEVTLGLGSLLYPLRLQGVRLGLVLLSSMYIFAIPWLGFTLTTFFFSFGSLYLLGVRSWSQLLGLPLVLAASGYGLFIVVLNARFPLGPVENALTGIFF